jgi:hypothetical protein
MEEQHSEQVKAKVAQLLEQAEELKNAKIAVMDKQPEENEEIITGEVTEEIPAPPPHMPRRIPLRWAIGIIATLLCLSILATVVYQWVFLATAQITIVPKSQTVRTTVTLSGAEIQARSLQPVSLSASQTVQTTGHGHQKAAYAQGVITFYNSLPAPQIMPAGTILASSKGTQVITDQTATIPAGSYAGYGTANVSAHSLLIGSTGNLPAGSIQGACCKAYILVYSGAFTGGADEKDFPMVTKSDLSRPEATLTKQLTSAIQTMFTSQVQPSETVLTPLSCTPKTTTDHREGEEAKTVTITITQTCNTFAYNTQAMQNHIQPVFSQEVAKQFPGYSVVGEPEKGSIAVTNKQPLAFSVQLTGNCQYHFTDTSLHQIQELIKGKSKDEALVLLLHYRGIQSVGITLLGITNQLPNDPGRIPISIISML